MSHSLWTLDNLNVVNHVHVYIHDQMEKKSHFLDLKTYMSMINDLIEHI